MNGGSSRKDPDGGSASERIIRASVRLVKGGTNVDGTGDTKKFSVVRTRGMIQL